MTWKQHDSDVKKYSLSEYVFSFIFLFILVGGALGVLLDFVPSERVQSGGMILSMPISLAMSIWIFNYHRKNSNSKSKLVISILIFPFLIFSLSWMFFVHSVPAVYTMLVGADHAVITEVTKTHHSGRKSCNYRISADVLNDSLPSYMCINKELYESPVMEVELVGKKSIAGELYSDILYKTAEKLGKD